MCIQTALQSKIAELTNDGDNVIRFLYDVVEGAIPGAKLCHRVDAAKTLARYGLAPTSLVTLTPSPVEDSACDVDDSASDMTEESPDPEPIETTAESSAGAQDPGQVPTLRDIVAYPVARYIRSRTNDGETLLNALNDIMTGGSHSRFEYEFNGPPPVKPNQRLSAAKEIMGRAFGESRPARAPTTTPVLRRPALTGSEKLAEARKLELVLDKDDPVNERFARLVRDRTNNGIDAAETMVRIVEDGTAEEGWLPAHRLAALRELIHRGYDLNYDAVTWEHLEAYRRASEDGRRANRWILPKSVTAHAHPKSSRSSTAPTRLTTKKPCKPPKGNTETSSGPADCPTRTTP